MHRLPSLSPSPCFSFSQCAETTSLCYPKPRKRPGHTMPWRSEDMPNKEIENLEYGQAQVHSSFGWVLEAILVVRNQMYVEKQGNLLRAGSIPKFANCSRTFTSEYTSPRSFGNARFMAAFITSERTYLLSGYLFISSPPALCGYIGDIILNISLLAPGIRS